MDPRRSLRFACSGRYSEVGAHVERVLAALPAWVRADDARMALGEALGNAALHGVLRVPGALRRAGDFERFFAVIEAHEALFGGEGEIDVAVVASDASVVVTVRDPGEGFDVRADVVEGRGRSLILQACPAAQWSAAGNEVRLRWDRPTNES